MISSVKTVSSETVSLEWTHMHLVQQPFGVLKHPRKTHQQAALVGFVLLSFVLKFIPLFFPMSST